MSQVLLIQNSLGDGDWFEISVDGEKVDSGHSVHVWTLVDLLKHLGHSIEVKEVNNEYFE